MKLLFYMGHPAHFHLFKETIKALQKKDVECIILIKTKDVLEDLLQSSNLPYINVFKEERKEGFLGLLSSFITKLWKLGRIIKQHKPNILIGSAAELAVLGKLFRIPSCILFEDDFEAVPQFAKIAGPLATHLICPHSCSSGKWKEKTINYQGYHELAYLGPNYFTASIESVKHLINLDKKNYLLRFSKLSAYHDKGIAGIQDEYAFQLVDMLKERGDVYISSERPLHKDLDQYRTAIDPKEMHQFLAHMDLFVGDSQTMTAEAAVLGTPSVRFNDFVGRLGYLEELEHRYELTYGIKSNQPQKMLDKVSELVEREDLDNLWRVRQQKMLKDNIDLTYFLTSFLFNYPASIKNELEMKKYS